MANYTISFSIAMCFGMINSTTHPTKSLNYPFKEHFNEDMKYVSHTNNKFEAFKAIPYHLKRFWPNTSTTTPPTSNTTCETNTQTTALCLISDVSDQPYSTSWASFATMGVARIIKSCTSRHLNAGDATTWPNHSQAISIIDKDVVQLN
jgi:hypothetical protein